jgi:hypothetical protein
VEEAIMAEPTFDIFKGNSEKDAVWVEAVQGLAPARERMELLASETPGQYFVYALRSRAILARVDTRKALKTTGKNKINVSGAA